MNAYRPMPGYSWNPLKGYRNQICPCGSGKKVKRCHGQADTIPTKMANTFKEFLRVLSATGMIEAKPQAHAPDPLPREAPAAEAEPE